MRYFWEYDVIYSNSQRSIATRKIHSFAKFREIKVQKNALCNVRNRMKFGNISGEDLLCTKMWKSGCRECDLFWHLLILICQRTELSAGKTKSSYILRVIHKIAKAMFIHGYLSYNKIREKIISWANQVDGTKQDKHGHDFCDVKN